VRILHVASECFPLVKVGGLGDVMGALPQALRAQGADARLLLPGFPGVMAGVEIKGPLRTIPETPGAGDAEILEARTKADVPLYILNIPALYDRPGNPYEERGDSHFKAAALAWAAAQIGLHGDGAGWKPQIVHAHDWQTGLTPLYVAFDGHPGHPATVISIHNLAYQGIYGSELLWDLNLPRESFHPGGAEFHSYLNFLKAGLAYADRIVTVSPTYAWEIQGPAQGWYLEDLLSRRSHELWGILNGADYEHWNPAKSPHLETHYSAEKPSGKKACKTQLQQEMGLDEAAGAPLFAVISRLAPQKGLDMLVPNLEYMLNLGAQLVILGTGEPELEAAFAGMAAARPWQMAARISYDEGLAHRILAGADVLLMPSRQEPCGLTQIYAMKYGTLPLVRRTGGLADTVTDAHEASLEAGTATGFVFDREDSWLLGETISRACALYRQQPKVWKRIQQTAMKQDFSWKASATRYLEMYEGLIG